MLQNELGSYLSAKNSDFGEKGSLYREKSRRIMAFFIRLIDLMVYFEPILNILTRYFRFQGQWYNSISVAPKLCHTNSIEGNMMETFRKCIADDCEQGKRAKYTRRLKGRELKLLPLMPTNPNLGAHPPCPESGNQALRLGCLTISVPADLRRDNAKATAIHYSGENRRRRQTGETG